MNEPPALPPRRDPIVPAHQALRDGLKRFVARRVPAHEVDDLVQEVFLKMQENADALRDDERVSAWAFRIARNAVNDHHRRKREMVPLDEASEPSESESAPADVNEIVASWLGPMLPLLPAEYADALEQVELRGMSQKAYAELRGLSVSGAKSRVQRARKMLEGVVRACCDLELDARGNVIGFTRRIDGSDENVCAAGCGQRLVSISKRPS